MSARSSAKKKGNVVLAFVNSFFGSSSIQGLTHINTEQHRHPVEILLWTVTVIAATYYSITLSQSVWQRYQENPTVISMERDRFVLYYYVQNNFQQKITQSFAF